MTAKGFVQAAEIRMVRKYLPVMGSWIRQEGTLVPLAKNSRSKKLIGLRSTPMDE